MLFKEILSVLTKADLLSNIRWLWHPTDIIIGIPGPYLADWKNDDAAIYHTNKHLSKKENYISKWSDKNDILVFYRGIRDSNVINNSLG